MARTCMVRFGKKDRELRGLVRLVKDNGEALSAYCSAAVQYFLKYGNFIQIATVVPETDDELCNVDLYFEQAVMDNLKAYMEKVQNRNRSNMVKLILMNSIEVSRSGVGELTPRFDLLRAFAGTGMVATEDKPRKSDSEDKATKAVSKPVKTTKKEIAAPEEAAVEEQDMEEPDDTDLDLVSSFFPNIKKQMAAWD